MTEIGPPSGAGNTPAVIYDFSGARARIEANRRQQAADTTGFTPEARELSRARAAVDATPEVRQAKVDALKHQIANGGYTPDPREVAAKILDQGL